MSDVKLGELIDGPMKRDAVHVAVLPAVAAHTLQPGDRVGMWHGFGSVAGTSSNPIGVVDPFLDACVSKDERFWICLFPGTITSLRHDWSHPSVVDVPTSAIDEVAKKCGLSTYRMVETAREYSRDGRRYPMGRNEDYTDVTQPEWAAFWAEFYLLEGVRPTNDGSPFTCAC